ncbi:MAG: IS1380 family transposase [Bdellovibrionales bacterium]|nr:IS1380 family transposase [Bdellovibrionales bacterium]
MLVPQSIDPKQGFNPKKIKIEATRESLVAHSGLPTIIDLFDSSPLSKEFSACLPERKSHRSLGSYRLGLILLASLASDHECLDDLLKFEDDESLEEYFRGEIPVPKTMGNFLRDFGPEHIAGLKNFLNKMGPAIRKHCRETLLGHHKIEKTPHYSIDSTFHEQHGDKIEGCAINYEGKWGLQTQVVFDELGINYAGELQTGGTKPGVRGEKLLEGVLAHLRAQKIDTPFERVSQVSADSAYIFEDFIKTCMANHSTFFISAPKTIKWEEQIDTDEDWVAWEYHIEEKIKAQKKGYELPVIYLKRWHWSPRWSEGKLKFPVIIKKEWKADKVFQDCGSWHYHAVATNENLSKHSYQSVIESYRRRANVENHIKEYKINFDAKHLPCLKYNANEAYMLFVLIAHNLLRWIAIIEEPTKPLYAKKLRRKYIFSPGKLVRHARQLVLKVSVKFKEVIEQLKEAWGKKPEIVPQQFSTA